MDNGRRIVRQAEKLYVFNEDKGVLECRSLQYVANDIEGAWYEEVGTYKTFDPFFVHKSKETLVKTVRKHLKVEIKAVEDHLKELNKRLRKLK